MRVFGLGGAYLGEARSFGEAKRLQEASLPADLVPAYGGVQDGRPVFYLDMLDPDLLEKYPELKPRT